SVDRRGADEGGGGRIGVYLDSTDVGLRPDDPAEAGAALIVGGAARVGPRVNGRTAGKGRERGRHPAVVLERAKFGVLPDDVGVLCRGRGPREAVLDEVVVGEHNAAGVGDIRARGARRVVGDDGAFELSQGGAVIDLDSAARGTGGV